MTKLESSNQVRSANEECRNGGPTAAPWAFVSSFVVRHSDLIRGFVIHGFIITIALLVLGCGAPNRANIELRKQNQQLQTQVNELQVRTQADQQVIQGLRDRSGVLPTLPSARLAQLFTTHGLAFGRLTGGADLDPSKPGDEGFVVNITPTDQSGDKLKAAGTFDIDAFDLDDPKNPLIGHWHFDLQQAKQAWTSMLMEYNYVLTCRWQSRLPRHPNLTIKVKFFDELTQTPFTAQRVIQINVPPQTQPS
jgi:hypothetical protein